MSKTARSICPEVDFRQGNAMTLPFGEASFDVVVGSFFLMFVRDPGRNGPARA